MCKGTGGHEAAAQEHLDAWFDGGIKYPSIKEKMPSLTVLALRTSHFSLAA